MNLPRTLSHGAKSQLQNAHRNLNEKATFLLTTEEPVFSGTMNVRLHEYIFTGLRRTGAIPIIEVDKSGLSWDAFNMGDKNIRRII